MDSPLLIPPSPKLNAKKPLVRSSCGEAQKTNNPDFVRAAPHPERALAESRQVFPGRRLEKDGGFACRGGHMSYYV